MTELLGNIEIMVMGFVTVLLVLSALWGGCVAVGLSFSHGMRGHTSKMLNEDDDEDKKLIIPMQHLVVIASAVSAIHPSPSRIVSVVTPAHVAQAWVHEGRFSQNSNSQIGWQRSPPAKITRRGRRKIW